MQRAFAPVPVLVALAFAGASSALLGCTPVIGDHCALSTDCSVQGTRVCDTSEPNGYCTEIGCTANLCPDNATCVEFNASLPGCGYDDYSAPSREGRSMCMRSCQSDSDCRESEGYSCVDPRVQSGAIILDSISADSPWRVCMVAGTATSSADAAVCSPDRPDAPPLDLSSGEGGAGVVDATVGGDAPSGDGADGTVIGPPDAGAQDASGAEVSDASDAGASDASGAAPVDGSEAGTGDASEAGLTDASDAGPVDASDASAVDATDEDTVDAADGSIDASDTD